MDFRRPVEHPDNNMDGNRYNGDIDDGTLPHAQPQQPVVIKKGDKLAKVMAWFWFILFLGVAGYGGFLYLTQDQLWAKLNDSQNKVTKLEAENDTLTEKNKTLSPGYKIPDNSKSYGKLFYNFYGSYSSIVDANAKTNQEYAVESEALEKAYMGSTYRVSASAQPLKDKEIAILSIYRENDDERALVYVSATATKAANFIPFAKKAGVWVVAN